MPDLAPDAKVPDVKAPDATASNGTAPEGPTLFDLGILSDEVGGDFERSCALIRGWGLRHVELRTLWGKNVVELTEAEAERARAVLDRHGLRVTALASPVFKSPLDGVPRELQADFALRGSETFALQLALLERAAGLAERFGTRMIRVFTFWREPWSSELVGAIGAKLLRAAEVARGLDVLLAVENEPVCSVGTGRQLAELWGWLRSQGADGLLEHLGPLWDPGNAAAAGERAYPDGYRALREHGVVHVHLKDLELGADGKATFLPLGWGQLDYLGQLRALARDGYAGPVVLEPHYRPPGTTQEDAAHTAVTAALELLRRAAGEG